MPKKQSDQERRRFQRSASNLAIKLEDREIDFVTETKNVSCIGAYCQVDSYLPILTKLRITLLFPKHKGLKSAKHIACEGSVVRVERSGDQLESNKYNIAIYFNQISRSDMKFIDAFVKNNTASPV